MIYLIDDNQSNQRIDQYGIEFIETEIFSDILTNISKLPKGDDLSFLKGAACILLHNTTEDVVDDQFIKGSVSNVTSIKEIISREGTDIPLVLFSYGMDGTADFPNPRYIRSISKPVFYGRLYDFLKHYAEFKEIELNILAYGNNFTSVWVAEHVHVLVDNLQFRDRKEFLRLSDIKLKTLESLIKLSSIQKSFNELIISLEDEPITIEKYLENLSAINESFANYGKNIYGWL